MKRIAPFVLVFSLCVLCVAGCGNKEDEAGTAAPNVPGKSGGAPAGAPAPAPAAAPGGAPAAGGGDNRSQYLNDPNVPADVKAKIRQNMGGK